MDALSELATATRKAALLGKRVREWRDSLDGSTPDEAKPDIERIMRYKRQISTTLAGLGALSEYGEETDGRITDDESGSQGNRPNPKLVREEKRREKLEEAMTKIVTSLDDVDITFRSAMSGIASVTQGGQFDTEVLALSKLHVIWPAVSDAQVHREIQILSPKTYAPSDFNEEIQAALAEGSELKKAVALRQIIHRTSQSSAIGRWCENVIGGMLQIMYAKYLVQKQRRFLGQIITATFEKVYAAELAVWRLRTDGRTLEKKAKREFRKKEVKLHRQQATYLRLYQRFGASALIQTVLIPATAGTLTKRSSLYSHLTLAFYNKINREIDQSTQGFADKWRERYGAPEDHPLVLVLRNWRRTSHDSGRALILQILRISLGNDTFEWASKWFEDNDPSLRSENGARANRPSSPNPPPKDPSRPGKIIRQYSAGFYEEFDAGGPPPRNTLGRDHPGLYPDFANWIAATCNHQTPSKTDYKAQGLTRK
ncbi:hypothetical protein FA15DRAFT_661631 [Coprinopsis marcescibilis]|uniref:Uncharacterized protein n=1 Tax=Coprinopsis marcescibilis TaxID=230819 RepID=A0A5C3KAV8_COPMA|nr:hypothetical protein FA15DRAFT_661631 [Coprinopsis marcescibilis]